MYCAKDILVREVIDLSPSAHPNNLLKLARSAFDASNNEEAVQYSNKVLELAPTNHEAWLIKAEAAGWLSTLQKPRMPEMISGFQNAIEFAPKEEQDDLRKHVATKINSTTTAFYQVARNHVDEFLKINGTWESYVAQCVHIINGLEAAHSFDPANKQILENLVHICRDNIEGAVFVDWERTNEWSSKRMVSDEYENVLKEKRDKYVQLIKQIDPDFEEKPIQKKTEGGGCFIATATMGDYNDPLVLKLRAFRDQFLLKSNGGRVFVKYYYKISPKLSKYIQRHSFLKFVSLSFIVIPSAWVAEKMLNRNS